MVGIAVAQAGVPQADAVVVDRHRAVHHLVEPVAVEVGHVERVVALGGVGAVLLAVLAGALVVGVEAPAAGELSVAPVPRLDDGAGIDAAPDDDGGQPRLVEAAHADAERAGALPVVVAPGAAGLAGYEVVAGQLAARLSVDDADELRPCRTVVVDPPGTARIEVAPRAVVDLAVAVDVRDLRAVAEHRALAGADGHLGTAVAVEVGHGE